jgi:hypothetical protein
MNRQSTTQIVRELPLPYLLYCAPNWKGFPLSVRRKVARQGG